jgi:hypothetical protein
VAIIAATTIATIVAVTIVFVAILAFMPHFTTAHLARLIHRSSGIQYHAAKTFHQRRHRRLVGFRKLVQAVNHAC